MLFRSAGYLTRRLVDVAQDVVVYITDCGTINGIVIADLKEGEEIIEPLSDRILGRTVLDDFIVKGEIVVKAGSAIEDEEAELIGDSGVENIRIRSILTWEAKRGCCAKCYGWDLSTHQLVDIGTAVGIRAAQSIGEPGTQLTMRTFHIGGAASRATAVDNVQVKHNGTIHLHNLKTITKASGELVAVSRSGELAVSDDESGRESVRYTLSYGGCL